MIRLPSVLLLTLAIGFEARAALVKKTYEYKDGGETFRAYVVYDDQSRQPRPGVLIVHDWMGFTDKLKDRADQVASLGYTAFAMDVFGKDVQPKDSEEASQQAGRYKKERPLLRERLKRALKELRGQDGVDKKRVAAIGYCFGGTSALELARSGADVKAVVSFHGGLDSPNPADGKKIKGKILALHGADDPFISDADLKAFEDELRKAKVDWQLIKYSGAVHSFTDKTAGSDNSKGAAYNATADRRSWEDMKQFFAEAL